MPLWRLSPVARADDPHWMGREIWREIVVEAPTAAAARIAATDWALPPARSPEEENLGRNPGFEDEKLYRIDELPESEAATDGDRVGEAVLSAERL